MPRFTIIPGITRPKSRGTVCLTAADPDAPLEIDPCYFSHPDDMRTMIQRRPSQPGDRRAGTRSPDGTPGSISRVPRSATDDEIAAYVARDVSTWFHPVGTCRMGIGADAVVDPTLRVHGVAGLRVADASIMPDIVSVNTNAAATMIGWKAGDHVLA